MPGISEQQRRELQAVFESWIISRFDIDIDRLIMILELNPKLRNSAMAKELIAEGKAVGKAEGIAEGLSLGKAAGKAEGQVEGKLAGKAELLKQLIAKRYGSVAAKVLSTIDTFDEATIQEFFDLALDTQAEEFCEAVLSGAASVSRG